MSKNVILPKFSSETAEAKWWDSHHELVERALVQAIKKGQTKQGMALKLTRTVRKARNITIRMPEDDINRLQRLADRKGVGYQTVMKMLLREALDREEKAGRTGRRAG